MAAEKHTTGKVDPDLEALRSLTAAIREQLQHDQAALDRLAARSTPEADAAIAAIEDGLATFFAGDWRYAWAASEPMTAADLDRSLFGGRS